MIYTSYFGIIKDVKNPIAICGKSPDWYMGPQYKKLAPKYWFFDMYKKGEIGKEEYTICFKREVLKTLNPIEVKKELFNKYPKEEIITLMCFETPDLFCHRQLVSAWLNSYGIKVKEFYRSVDG